MFPLQGFYTLLVVINPNYKKVRRSSPNPPILKAFAIAILSYGGAAYTQRLSIRDVDETYEENQHDSTQITKEEDVDEEIIDEDGEEDDIK
eukprot:CAMPEP_0198261056 /NCGR_PEP_ID=MMETSP1447-20131203/9857_1 /TAXON_ID=420782 /ORGANISM="Chaetoceros dichaeta, Strain CCMP1751" /LENGTH=90 /DNA_ID=CAMNT_0043948849 /DNA_START=957 /DNA_END=1229 /DNA_ORIENTATION=+